MIEVAIPSELMQMADVFTSDPKNLKVKDFVLSDEYEIIDADEDLKGAITKLLSMNCGVLLVKEGKDIEGVVTERKILKRIAEAKDPMKLTVKDIMDTKILRIDYNDKIPEAMEKISTEKPAAVIVVGKDGDFRGYFSPIDYLQAEKMIKEAKKRRPEAPVGDDDLADK